MMQMIFSFMMLNIGLMVMQFYKENIKMWWVILIMVYFMKMLILKMPLYESMKLMGGYLMLDTLSVNLMILSLLLLILMFLASSQIINMNFYAMWYSYFLIFLLVILLLSFMMSNYLYFYFFFEASLIPTLYVITGWGYQPERLQAGLYFLVYTLFMSLPLLVVLVVLDLNFFSLLMWDSILLNLIQVSFTVVESGFMLFLIGAFLVKLPMFLVHLWLPKAHVEAPVSGSMILAGVLLKLGGFGLMRMVGKAGFVFLQLNSIFISLSLVGMVFIGLVCCRLSDLKALVAYSSVAHMGLVISGVFTMFKLGLMGSVLMMLSHGLSSSGLFCFVNMMYERTGSRSIYMNKGVISLIPIFSLLFFLLCCSNISAPPSINLVSEIMLISSINSFNVIGVFLFAPGAFLGAVFTFYMFSSLNHGKWANGLYNIMFYNFIEIQALMLHLLPINVLIFKNEFLVGL